MAAFDTISVLSLAENAEHEQNSGYCLAHRVLSRHNRGLSFAPGFEMTREEPIYQRRTRPVSTWTNCEAA